MDRPGVPQVPEGSGEQGKMEKTGCKIICGAPTTLMVKGIDDDECYHAQFHLTSMVYEICPDTWLPGLTPIMIIDIYTFSHVSQNCFPFYHELEQNKTLCPYMCTPTQRLLPVRLTTEFFLRLLDSVQLAILSAPNFEHLHR